MIVAQERILDDQHISVFFLKNLRRPYWDWLKHLGADGDVIRNVNVTRLKEKLLAKIPGLWKQKNGKFLILTVQEDIGRAIVQCSQNTRHDERITLSKASTMVRRFLFTKRKHSKETSFNNYKKRPFHFLC